MDQIIDIKNFKTLNDRLIDEKTRKNIRILSVFGYNGSEVIYVTTDDTVYGFGQNKFGCLGLGVWDDPIPEPTLNETLSGRQLTNIYYGFGHVIAVTRDGQCYGWGENEFGQVGNGSMASTHTPTLIRGLIGQRVVEIRCGNRHTMALTSDGQLYTWGRNTFGQLGDRSFRNRLTPFKIPFKFKIASISCGKCHSLALAHTGRVYIWGLNETGQLGRHRDEDIHEDRHLAMSCRPEALLFYNVRKAVCGRNHTLILTEDRDIYAFGNNARGQVGNGSLGVQYTPIKVNGDVKFKDIEGFCDYDISLAVSIDDKIFVWGLCLNRKFLTPRPIPDPLSDYSLFDVFAIYTRIGKTYKSIVISDNRNGFRRINGFFFPRINGTINGFDDQKKTIEHKRDNEDIDKESMSSSNTSNGLDQCLAKNYKTDNICAKDIFLNQLIQAFNNPLLSDMEFIIEEQVIYCHKNILRIRNKKFWKKYFQNSTKIHIKCNTYKAFKALIEWFYGKRPEIDGQNCIELLRLAIVYEEQELKDTCIQWFERNFDLSNVCSVYELAIESNSTQLKNSCIEFAKSNWKSILKSQEFEEMNQKLVNQFMTSFVI